MKDEPVFDYRTYDGEVVFTDFCSSLKVDSATADKISYLLQQAYEMGKERKASEICHALGVSR